MLLTQSRPEDILSSGTAVHSPIAAEFIREVRQSLGICIEACYLQSGTHPLFDDNIPIAKQLQAGCIPFVNEDILQLYIHTKKSADIPPDIEETAFSILMRILCENGKSICYTRQYHPKEMQFYGWYSLPREQWDLSKVIPMPPTASHRHSVLIEAIDQLSLWNILCDAKAPLSRCDFIRELGAKVYVSHNAKRGTAALYVIVSSDTLHTMNIRLFKEACAEYVCRILKPKDVWDVITPDSAEPVVTEWNALTKEQRFSMLRG